MLALMAPPLARITCTKKYYKIRKEFHYTNILPFTCMYLTMYHVSQSMMLNTKFRGIVSSC